MEGGEHTPMQRWDVEMARLALFLASVCHVLLVVSDELCDSDTANFVRSLYSLRQSTKVNSFLRHDASLRSKLKALQTRMGEDTLTPTPMQSPLDQSLPMHMMGAAHRRQARRVRGSGRSSELRREQRRNAEVLEEEALFYGLGARVSGGYEVFSTLNAQQRYGFPDLVFVQNKVGATDMCAAAFDGQRAFLDSMFTQQFAARMGEVANECFVRGQYGQHGQHGREERRIEARMNCFFLPRVEGDGDRDGFECAVRELDVQLMAMAKPPAMAQSQTELEWFSFCKKIWHFVGNAANLTEYRQLAIGQGDGCS